MQTERRPSFTKALLIFSAFCILILMPPEAARNITEHPKLTILWVILYLGFFVLIIALGKKLYQRYDHFPHRVQGFFAKAKTILGGYLAIVAGEIVLGSLNRLIYHQVQTANNQAIIDSMNGNPIIIGLVCFSAVCLTPFAEELIFRGLFMNLFFDGRAFWLPIIFSGLIFTLVHASSNIISYLIYFYMGCVLAYVYCSTGNLSNSIGVHLINNLVSIMLILPAVIK